MLNQGQNRVIKEKDKIEKFKNGLKLCFNKLLKIFINEKINGNNKNNIPVGLTKAVKATEIPARKDKKILNLWLLKCQIENIKKVKDITEVRLKSIK